VICLDGRRVRSVVPAEGRKHSRVVEKRVTQNIYDNATFFEQYSRLARSVEGLDGAAEWPALRAMLPDLRDRKVVDLGCGFGWFCRWAREQGAATVLGIDVSERMLARARSTTPDPAITYRCADLEQLALEPGFFDFAYSSLALHYVTDLAGLVATIRGALVPGSAFVFSVEHPIYTAPADPRWSDATGRRTWPLDRYMDEGTRSTDWLAKGVIKQHRMLATYLNVLVRTGFILSHVEEWGPTEEQIAVHPEWADERRRPPFLLVAARRP
jgi:SAM-dependent methyltransferase